MTKRTGRPRGRPRMYHFGDLDVDQSFLIKLRSTGHRISVAAAARAYSCTYGGKFRTELARIDALGEDRNRPTGQTATHVRVTRIA